jgi:hypothetical protein
MPDRRATAAEIKLMLHRCGLSQTDAAAVTSARDRTVRRWLAGDDSPEPEKWQRLVDLCARQDAAADELLALARARAGGRWVAVVTLHMARTDEEAQHLGWPCAGAHVAVIRRVVERAPRRMRVVPVYGDEAPAAELAAARRPFAR